ncbi:DUF4235 domain-containing protein [Auraticoccus monumenti]|uniref:DUF4235 domain-containing protein n=1 Tax=Auraticoccus monumenti TaxID=675864 RepID=A0A1G6TVC4_9ACTN|nr:DUF4235 domain-containing protein [Auraticoccus monumenti]SDD33048.1 Protein of unknown function [Auraticoccus monumenti]
MGKLATIAYRPIGLASGLAAGALSGIVFKQIWKRVADEEDAPGALQSEYSFGHVILAAALQGMIFAAVKAAVDRAGAKGFQRITGFWPGK